MIRTRIAVFVLLGALFSTSTAYAQLEEPGGDTGGGGGGSSPGFGVGMETILTAPFAPTSVTPFSPAGALAGSYDTGQFRIDALLFLLFVEDGATTFALGGRFFYKLHSSSRADFSAGGGIALGFVDGSGRSTDSDIRVAMEGAFQLRVWLASNVALNGSAGLGFSFGDNPFIFGLSGHLMGGFGLIYYFD